MYRLVAFVVMAHLGLAHGHMIMNTPHPYNLHSAPLLQVNPLGADFPFPCQGRSTVEQVTPLKAGETQRVAFTGGAQHGGGSCQFSLTYEYPPPADKSKWRTIYTLIGGCPVSAAGNLPAAQPDAEGRADSPQCGDDTGVECIREFQVPIPRGLPSGNATFAWTWFNKIGNRELYMNCAPVAITGGADEGDTTFFDTLPQMFVANIPGECTTNNGVLNIPNPGEFGRVLEQPASGSEGSCPKAAGVPVFEGDGGAAVPSVPEPEPESAPTTTATTTGPPAATQSQPSGFVTITTSVATAHTTATILPAVPPSELQPAVPAAGCSPDGAIICIGTTQFAICDHGRAVPQALAAGTTCSNGVIARV